MGKIFCVEFQRYPLKLHVKYLTHTLKDMIFTQHRNFKSSYAFLKRPLDKLYPSLLKKMVLFDTD